MHTHTKTHQALIARKREEGIRSSQDLNTQILALSQDFSALVPPLRPSLHFTETEEEVKRNIIGGRPIMEGKLTEETNAVVKEMEGRMEKEEEEKEEEEEEREMSIKGIKKDLQKANSRLLDMETHVGFLTERLEASTASSLIWTSGVCEGV